jgi:L-histidine N-alpha-methyltransferase
MPRSAAFEPPAVDRKRFADDVAYYLALTPRQLPSRYFYDALGSALFDAICRLPWYAISRAEQRLLSEHASSVWRPAAEFSVLIELGPGTGEKLEILLDSAERPRRLALHLVDVSAAALAGARRRLEDQSGVTILTHQSSYEAGLESAAHRRGGDRTLALFLGSNIGNFDPPSADAFLHGVRASLAAGDAFLLGADLVKPERDLLLAYDDPLGVTAAFNRNLLVRINRELHADFDVDAFAHRALWNATQSRVEMHLVSTRRQRVRVAAADLEIVFEKDEAIWTESSYKYDADGIVAMLERAGFRRVDQWIDAEAAFALTLVEAV